MRTHAFVTAFTGLLLLVTFLSGFGLSRDLRLNDPRPAGQPPTSAMSAVHKLSAIVMAIFACVTVRKLHRGMQFNSIELTVVMVAGLGFVLMVVSGSLLSLGRARSDGTLAVHNVGSLLTLVSTSAAIYLLTRGRW